MVEVEVREDDAVDVGVRDARLLQAVEKHMPFFLHSIAIAKLRRKEGADPRFEQDLSVPIFDEQSATGEWDAIQRVGLDPALPKRLRGVSEHRAPVEALGIAQDRPCPLVPHFAEPSRVVCRFEVSVGRRIRWPWRGGPRVRRRYR